MQRPSKTDFKFVKSTTETSIIVQPPRITKEIIIVFLQNTGRFGIRLTTVEVINFIFVVPKLKNLISTELALDFVALADSDRHVEP